VSSFDLTRRVLSLSTRDDVMHWCSKVFSESTIKGSIQPQGANFSVNGIGFYAQYPYTLFTPNGIQMGDEIEDDAGQQYKVLTVSQFWRGDEFIYYTCQLDKKLDSDRDATSGTWHVDSESLKTDSRYKHIAYLDSYVPAPVWMFSGVDYPLLYEFLAGWQDNDVVGTIDKSTLTPYFSLQATNDVTKPPYYKVPYKYLESVPITVWAITKTGVTPDRIIDQTCEDIKEAFTYYPASDGVTLRGISKIDNHPQTIGAFKLYSSTVTVDYWRNNDDFTGSNVTLTWGPSASPTGTYTFPNVTDISYPNVNNDIFVKVPGRVGERLQRLGSNSLEVRITCDLDFNPRLKTWKRPQTTSPKTDTIEFQVFLDIMHNALSQTYQTLDLGWGSFKVRLVDMQPTAGADNNEVTLNFKEYVAANASGDAYTTRYGI